MLDILIAPLQQIFTCVSSGLILPLRKRGSTSSNVENELVRPKYEVFKGGSSL